MSTSEDCDVLDASALLSLDELTRSCGVEAAWVEEMVAQGVVAPADGTRYTVFAMSRIRKARRLERDFSLNSSGIALALDLLDEIDRLRARLRHGG
jgi:chaperone modulatory protein CbpM